MPDEVVPVVDYNSILEVVETLLFALDYETAGNCSKLGH